MTPTMINATTVVPFATLRAIALVTLAQTQGGDQYALLVLHAFAVGWLRKEMAAGGFVCPVCGNLWTTREKREACNHQGGSVHEPTRWIIKSWADEAEATP